MNYLIIGSGLIGRLTAWRLVQAGNEVAILSKDDRQGSDSAGYVAAAMVSPATEALSAEPIVKTIGLESYRLWSEWLTELPEQIYYQDTGTLVVAHQGDKPEMARFKRRANYVLEQSDYQDLDKQQLAEHEPDLAELFDQALYFEQESFIDNRHLYQVLTDLLAERCQWVQCEHIDHLDEANIAQLCKQYLDCNSDCFDSVIDCRGNGANQDLSTLRGVRGEVIRVHAPEVNFSHAIRLIHPRFPFYLAPRPNNEYVLGATVVESDDRSPITIRSGLELMSALYSLHKGFAEARILEMDVHCRPGMPDNLPTIKRTSWGYHINGFYRHGYLFGPAIVSDLLHLLNGNQNQVIFEDLYDI
jgi:glycine oxidase